MQGINICYKLVLAENSFDIERRSLIKPGLDPLVPKCLNSGMIGLHSPTLMNEAVTVPIIGHIMFVIFCISVADLYMRTVRIRWHKIRNIK